MQIKLQNVRLSFPQLFIPKAVQQGKEAKYSASFLLDKTNDAAQIDAVRKTMFDVAVEKWGDAAKIPKGLKKCLHEGAEKDYDGYNDAMMFVSASATVRPSVIDRNRSPLTADDGRPYAGCYVNAVLRLWAQDNEFGKRINAQLQGVQFVSDGEAFGAAPFNPDEHFAPLDNPASDNDGGDDAGFDAHRVEKQRSPGGQEIDPKTGFPVGF